MKRQLIAATVALMILTIAGASFAGPHGGRPHGGGPHFRRMPQHFGGPHPGQSAHHRNIARPGGFAHHGNGVCPGGMPRHGGGARLGEVRPPRAEPPQNGEIYTEESYSESYSDNGYIGNNTVSAVFTILNGIFGMAQNIRNSNYAAQEDENITYITPEMENGNKPVQAQEVENAKYRAHNMKNFNYAMQPAEGIEPGEN